MSKGYRCSCCQVSFQDDQEHKAHYRQDNGRRSVSRHSPNCSFRPVRPSPVIETRSATESSASPYCPICSKQFHSKQTFDQHLFSKKHIARKQRMAKDDTRSIRTLSSIEPGYDVCPFCSECLEPTLQHLEEAHGFVVPNSNLVIDEAGLVSFLNSRARTEKCCLYCDWQFEDYLSALQHMRDKSHLRCSEALLIELDQFMDYGPAIKAMKQAAEEEEDDSESTDQPEVIESADYLDYLSARNALFEVTNIGELRLASGKLLGSRTYKNFYRKNFLRLRHVAQQLMIGLQPHKEERRQFEPVVWKEPNFRKEVRGRIQNCR